MGGADELDVDVHIPAQKVEFGLDICCANTILNSAIEEGPDGATGEDEAGTARTRNSTMTLPATIRSMIIRERLTLNDCAKSAAI